MVEGGSSPAFAAETLQRLRILRQVFGEEPIHTAVSADLIFNFKPPLVNLPLFRPDVAIRVIILQVRQQVP